jgi:3-hydroxyisobutyrate dehydrogenase-like beta-hydroxyacid dehydrogenase
MSAPQSTGGERTGKERVGFVGIGYMGHGMARNLLAKGHPLGFIANRKREAAEDLIAHGAVEFASPAALAAASDVVILCLPNSDVIERVATGPDGLIEGARQGLLVMDASTANPVSTLALARLFEAKHTAFVDAPLGRTPKEAAAGTLDSFIGAPAELFPRVEAIARCYSGKVVHVGGVGAAHQIKLINNMISLGYGALYAEALAMCRKVGISPQVFFNVISGGRMDCGFFQTFMPYTLNGKKDGHLFEISNAAKDTRYAEALADSVGLSNPIGNAVKNSYAMAVGLGFGGLHVPMIADVVAIQNGVDLGHPPGERPLKTDPGADAG